MTLTCHLIDEERFGAMAAQWRDCLAKSSSAHPLFMSWSWLFSWWETWANELSLELCLVGVFNNDDQLVGIGPFYRKDFLTPVGIRIKRLHLIGNAWHIAPTVRTEYCGLILNDRYSAAASRKIFDFISCWDWDEWVICDSTERALAQIDLEMKDYGVGATRIVRSTDEGVIIDTKGAFEDWLARLGGNTRRKVFNRRRYLEQFGKIEIIKCNESDIGYFFARLNEFHMKRWGKPAFDEKAIKFHKALIGRLPECSGRLECSLLLYDDECISVLYDIAVKGHQLNLQSGFLEDFDRKLALGFLHLGFTIEQAFHDPETFYYDLLAGGGKNHYYKRHFGGRQLQFNTLQCVRNPWLRLAYGAQRKLPKGLKRLINRLFKL